MDIRRLAVTLKHANSCPPFQADARQDFYALKQAICAAYGQRDGIDVQHIRDKCSRCTDGFVYTEYEMPDEICRKCGGSGIYADRWILLERWKIAGHVFHRPVGHTESRTATIEGRITHRPSRLAYVAHRVLALTFRPQYYLYLDQFRMGSADLGKFKAVMAYMLGFSRDRWRTKPMKLNDVI